MSYITTASVMPAAGTAAAGASTPAASARPPTRMGKSRQQNNSIPSRQAPGFQLAPAEK